MDDLIDLFAPRLKCGLSTSVPQAFQMFYEASFAHISANVMSDRVKTFLEEVVAAVPGMILVQGLQLQDTLSPVRDIIFKSDGAYKQAESHARFPYAHKLLVHHGIVNEPVPHVFLDDATIPDFALERDVSTITVSDMGGEYDADISQSQTQIRGRTTSKGDQTAASAAKVSSHPSEVNSQANEAIFSASPAKSENMPSPEDSDVFGPMSRRITKSKKGKGGRSRKRATSSRPMGELESKLFGLERVRMSELMSGQPELKRMKIVSPEQKTDTSQLCPPATIMSARSGYEDGEEEEDCISVYQSPPALQIVSKSSRKFRGPLPISPKAFDLPQSSESDNGQGKPILSRIDQNSRPSLFTSARALLARVPSLFSPTAAILPMQPEREVPGSNTEQVQVAEQLQVTEETVSQLCSTSPEKGSQSQSKLLSESSTNRKSKKRGRPRKSTIQTAMLDVKVPEQSTRVQNSKRKVAEGRALLQTGEDELLLSPDSARKRRREEEGDIAAAVERSE